jgi:hypothetical protein
MAVEVDKTHQEKPGSPETGLWRPAPNARTRLFLAAAPDSRLKTPDSLYLYVAFTTPHVQLLSGNSGLKSSHRLIDQVDEELSTMVILALPLAGLS